MCGLDECGLDECIPSVTLDATIPGPISKALYIHTDSTMKGMHKSNETLSKALDETVLIPPFSAPTLPVLWSKASFGNRFRGGGGIWCRGWWCLVSPAVARYTAVAR